MVACGGAFACACTSFTRGKNGIGHLNDADGSEERGESAEWMRN